MDCPKCGAANKEGANQCVVCGESMPEERNHPQRGTGSSIFMSRLSELKWILLGYLIASVCCMSAACLLGYRFQWILWQLGLR
jgi:uncharacterized membrane protein YvbJ